MPFDSFVREENFRHTAAAGIPARSSWQGNKIESGGVATRLQRRRKKTERTRIFVNKTLVARDSWEVHNTPPTKYKQFEDLAEFENDISIKKNTYATCI